MRFCIYLECRQSDPLSVFRTHRRLLKEPEQDRSSLYSVQVLPRIIRLRLIFRHRLNQEVSLLHQ